MRGSLLFLSGRADHMEKYAETLHDWAARGWRVESFDWRGQGGSGRLHEDGLLGHVDDFACWLDDLEAYAREWRARGPGPHVVVAHSMGGHLLLRALAEKRVDADAAVLVAPMLGIHAGGVPHMVADRIVRAMCAMGNHRRSLWPPRGRRSAMDAAIRTTLTHSKARFDQEIKVRRERPDLIVDSPSWGWLRAAYHSIALLERPDSVEQVRTPLLILVSRADRLVSCPAIMRMVRRLPHARTHVYGRQAAHEILREVDSVRDDALARIDAFLDETAPARMKREQPA